MLIQYTLDFDPVFGEVINFVDEQVDKTEKYKQIERGWEKGRERWRKEILREREKI